MAEATVTLLQSYGKPIDEDLLALVVVFGHETAEFARTYGAAEAATKLKSEGEANAPSANSPALGETPER